MGGGGWGHMPMCLTTTSGTTGKPKGVVTPHRAALFCFHARNAAGCFPYEVGEVEAVNLFFTWEAPRALLLAPGAVPLLCLADSLVLDPTGLVGPARYCSPRCRRLLPVN